MMTIAAALWVVGLFRDDTVRSGGHTYMCATTQNGEWKKVALVLSLQTGFTFETYYLICRHHTTFGNVLNKLRSL